MCGLIPSSSCSTRSSGRASSPVCLPTTSAATDSCGAIPSTTGTLYAATGFAGPLPGYAPAWHISAGAPTARAGHWVSGPGAEFFSTLQRELGALPFIAEDLGVVTPEVRALRDQFHIPGTRVLQFAFDGAADNPHLPTNYVPNTVVYTGTHDNATTRGWFEGLPDAEQQHVWSYLKRPTGRTDEASWELIGLAWASRAALAMVPLQDVLNLGAEARMNVPGHAEGNWSWRCTEGMLDSHAFQRLRELTTASHRHPPLA